MDEAGAPRKLGRFRSTHSRRGDRFRKARQGAINARERGRSNSPHMRRWFISNDRGGQKAMLTKRPTLSGWVVDGGVQVPYESKSTARRPWTVRNENRARSKRARRSRQINARVAKRR